MTVLYTDYRIKSVKFVLGIVSCRLQSLAADNVLPLWSKVVTVA